MNEITPHSRQRTIHQIAAEPCELYQQQIDTLQGGTIAGLAKANWNSTRRGKGGLGNCEQV